VRAVDGVSFEIGAGETFGLVGESGCGKTTLGRVVLRLVPATSGSVHFAGKDLLALGRRELRATRRELQVVFQDPYSSLDPRMRVEEIVGEGLTAHRIARGAARRERVRALLTRVGLPADALDRLPHEFSAGQRQRIGIARALALTPRLVVLDEPVSALDLSVRAHIVNLLMDLREELSLAYLFIAHDLSMVRSFCHRAGVMYLGQLVEVGPAEDVFAEPAHPYTRALVDAIPRIDGARPRPAAGLGESGPAESAPDGCRFHPRCPEAMERCRREAPPVYDLGVRQVACFLFEADGSVVGRPVLDGKA
jgi:peptide/nickel transport system ATP-binding protein